MAGALGEVGTIAKFTHDREWKLAGRLVEPRKGHSGILLSTNKLLVVGGEGLRLVFNLVTRSNVCQTFFMLYSYLIFHLDEVNKKIKQINKTFVLFHQILKLV